MGKISRIIFVFWILLLFSVPASADISEVEDNNTIDKAGSISLTEDLSGSGYYVGRGLGSINPATHGDYLSDPDYWRFETCVSGLHPETQSKLRMMDS